MKIYEIAAPRIMSEGGMVEPNTLMSIQNIVKRGGANNHFEFLVMTRLLQMLKNGSFYRETNPFESDMSTCGELIFSLREMEPAKLAKIAEELLKMLEVKDADVFAKYCCPDMGYEEWIKLVTAREANESLVNEEGKITYSSAGGDISVILDGKLVGEIQKVSPSRDRPNGGYQYVPKGSSLKNAGEIYPSLQACKKSLTEG